MVNGRYIYILPLGYIYTDTLFIMGIVCFYITGRDYEEELGGLA